MEMLLWCGGAVSQEVGWEERLWNDLPVFLCRVGCKNLNACQSVGSVRRCSHNVTVVDACTPTSSLHGEPL